ERTLHDVAGDAGRRRLESEIDLLAMPLDQLGLVVERVHLAHAAVHEELNNAAGLGLMMQAAVELWFRQRQIGKQPLEPEQLRQRQPAEATAEVPQQLATRKARLGGRENR